MNYSLDLILPEHTILAHPIESKDVFGGIVNFILDHSEQKDGLLMLVITHHESIFKYSLGRINDTLHAPVIDLAIKVKGNIAECIRSIDSVCEECE